MQSRRDGFTVLEVLIVLAIIAVLLGLVLFAIDPEKQFAGTRNATRRADVAEILNAVSQYAIDNDASAPPSIDGTAGSSQVIGTDTSGCDATCSAVTTVSSCADLASDLVPSYLPEMPADPSMGTQANTDYYVNQDANGRIAIGACDPEDGATVSITR